MKTIADTAEAITVLMADHTRARISQKSIMHLAERSRLRDLFMRELTMELDDRGWALIELNRGGFCLVKISSLDGVAPLTPDD